MFLLFLLLFLLFSFAGQTCSFFFWQVGRRHYSRQRTEMKTRFLHNIHTKIIKDFTDPTEVSCLYGLITSAVSVWNNSINVYFSANLDYLPEVTHPPRHLVHMFIKHTAVGRLTVRLPEKQETEQLLTHAGRKRRLRFANQWNFLFHWLMYVSQIKPPVVSSACALFLKNIFTGTSAVWSWVCAFDQKSQLTWLEKTFFRISYCGLLEQLRNAPTHDLTQ